MDEKISQVEDAIKVLDAKMNEIRSNPLLCDLWTKKHKADNEGNTDEADRIMVKIKDLVKKLGGNLLESEKATLNS